MKHENRVIKFRAWNGTVMVYDVMVGKFGAFYVNPGDKGNGLHPDDSASINPLNSKYFETIPIMQFTGLYDFHKEDLYDGDIIEAEFTDGQKCRHVIYYDDTEASFKVKFIHKKGLEPTGGISQQWIDEFKKLKVGNIYQHKHLLE